MSYQISKNGEITFGGFENGIATSPHKGIGNLQSVNISTETEEVMCSFERYQQTQVRGTGTLTQVNTNTVSISGINLLVGSVITILVDSGTGLSGNYYYLSTGKLYSGALPPSDPATATVVTGITSGSATFTIAFPMGKPIQKATERYTDTSNNVQYRYFVLCDNGTIYCHDTATIGGGIDTPVWFFVDSTGNPPYGGLAVLNGWLTWRSSYPNNDYWKSTSLLGASATGTSQAFGLTSQGPFSALVGHQGKMYITDGNFIASLFPNTSLITGAANVQSYCQYTASATQGTISALIGGSVPSLGAGSTVRIPAVFFTGGTLPAALAAGTIYYIEPDTVSSLLFKVYAAASGGAALNIQTGAVGKQYFNTFYPISSAGRTMVTFTPQRLNLPFFETAQCMTEVGNTVIVGGKTNTLYPWNQVDPLPYDLIPLPENNVVNMITVNNMAYVFAGQKGNIYVTNGSAASLALSVPDYCAGLAGTPASYIEPYFTWGDAMYMRGRVWFSIQDQTATKTGNCGGIWSFTPTQNFFIGQDTGMALRLENQASYGTYNGASSVLLPSETQTAIGPQYWNGWYSSTTSPLYGIDFTDTITGTSAVIETDLVPTGTMLDKKTFTQIEYKLAAPLASGETVQVSYRQNGTDSYVTCGTAITESATGLSGYFPVNFEKGQWLQLKITLNPLNNSSSSFVRLKNVIVR